MILDVDINGDGTAEYTLAYEPILSPGESTWWCAGNLAGLGCSERPVDLLERQHST